METSLTLPWSLARFCRYAHLGLETKCTDWAPNVGATGSKLAIARL